MEDTRTGGTDKGKKVEGKSGVGALSMGKSRKETNPSLNSQGGVWIDRQ